MRTKRNFILSRAGVAFVIAYLLFFLRIMYSIFFVGGNELGMIGIYVIYFPASLSTLLVRYALSFLVHREFVLFWYDAVASLAVGVMWYYFLGVTAAKLWRAIREK